MSTRQTKKTKSAEKDPQADPQVSQIRDLIFGQQMHDYEDRFARLEAKLTEEVNTLRVSVEQNLAELQNLMTTRASDIESASVPRSQIADSLEKLARTLRG